MTEEEDYGRGETTQEKIRKTGNFKALYNKKYGDIANLNHRHTITPEQLFDLAVKYFTWAESNAIKAAETAAFQGVVTENLVHKVRVFTINGFCLFAGISASVVIKWRKDPGFAEVMEFVDTVVYEQKYQLAASGIVNPGFMGKDIGIDKPVEITQTNNNVSTVDVEQFKDAVNDILGQL